MDVAIRLLDIGGWIVLAAGLVWMIRHRRPFRAACQLLSLAVLLLYGAWFLRYRPWGLDWNLSPAALEVATVLVLGGLVLSWRAGGGLGRALGVLAILAGFAVVYPGVVFHIEFGEGG